MQLDTNLTNDSTRDSFSRGSHVKLFNIVNYISIIRISKLEKEMMKRDAGEDIILSYIRK